MTNPSNPNSQAVDSVEKYEFEPIKGYPMLNWKGKRPFTSTAYYPAQLKERYGETVDNWMSRIYWGDNLQVMSHLLKEFRGKINLVYIDPPFDSKADYKKKISLRGQQVTNDLNSFEEKQYTDIWTNDEYLQFMYERLILIRELLADDGSIYLHCDWHKNHYLRCVLDEIFGLTQFQNEIVWHYSGWNKKLKSNFNQRWDSIIFYSKTNTPIFNSYSIPWESKEHYVKARKQQLHIDDNGQEYVFSDAGGGKRVKRYLEEAIASGRHIDDMWNLDKINNSAKESHNYPTQKPEALLERIIKASSNPGHIIFDCFMGSGTTQAVAMKLGRRFIGADINLGAVQITTNRLLNIQKELTSQPQQTSLNLQQKEEDISTYYTGFEVYNVNHYDIFKNPIEAKELLIEALELQALGGTHLFDGEKEGRMYKIMPVDRIATRKDLNELIAGFDYKAFEKKQKDNPNQPVKKITLVCMGHEPDLGLILKKEVSPYNIDVEVVDILKDRQDIQFKRDSEVKITLNTSHSPNGERKMLVIENFYPMNLLGKLSLQQENVEDWRELVESIMIDWNYDGAILEPSVFDIPDKKELVKGTYEIPKDAGTIKVKITDLLSESLEIELQYG